MRLLPQLLLMGATLMVPPAHAATTTTEPPSSQHTSAHPRAKKIPAEVNNTVSDNLNAAPRPLNLPRPPRRKGQPPVAKTAPSATANIIAEPALAMVA